MLANHFKSPTLDTLAAAKGTDNPIVSFANLSRAVATRNGQIVNGEKSSRAQDCFKTPGHTAAASLMQLDVNGGTLCDGKITDSESKASALLVHEAFRKALSALI